MGILKVIKKFHADLRLTEFSFARKEVLGLGAIPKIRDDLEGRTQNKKNSLKYKVMKL